METLKKNTQYEILTPNGWEDFHGIRKLTKSNYVKLKNYNLTCSDNHRILVDDTWRESRELDHESYTNDIELYDPVGVKSSSYLSNGIISHNCDFLGSSNTLISSAKLHTLVYTKPILRTKDGMCIYQEPIRKDPDNPKVHDHLYFITADVAEGQGKDYTAMTVVDVTEFPYKVVATYRNNTVSPLLFASVLKTVAKKYNNAHVLVEINSIGIEVANILHTDLEYENIVKTAMMGRKGQIITEGFGPAKKVQMGVKTSVITKKVGCQVLKNLIEEDKLIVEDADLISEFTTFISKKQSFEAEDGHNDDLVMCLVLFAWSTRQQYFKNLTDMDVRLAMYQQEIDKIEDDMLPFGYYIDGVNDIEDKEEDIKWSSGGDHWLIFDRKNVPTPWDDLKPKKDRWS
jgi:hypothetical protein